MKHIHHIIPKHMGGTDDPSNLIELTIEEHAEAHRELYEKYGDEFDRLAHLSLSGAIGKEEIIEMKLKASSARSSGNTGRKLSREWKENLSKSVKESWIKKIEEGYVKPTVGEKNGMYGRKRTAEEKELMSKNRKGKGLGNRRPRTEEEKRKQSEAMKGKPAWNKGIKRTEAERKAISEGRLKRRHLTK